MNKNDVEFELILDLIKKLKRERKKARKLKRRLLEQTIEATRNYLGAQIRHAFEDIDKSDDPKSVNRYDTDGLND